MECYFANMTTYSLFKPHSIEAKFPQMRSRAESEALIAAMFSFSARFDGGHDFGGRTEDCPAPNYFAHIASSQLDRALNECGDMTPPLWVLQACTYSFGVNRCLQNSAVSTFSAYTQGLGTSFRPCCEHSSKACDAAVERAYSRSLVFPRAPYLCRRTATKCQINLLEHLLTCMA